MLNLTANFLTAATRRGVKPIWLVELPGLFRFLSTTDPVHLADPWRFGDGLILGAGALFGALRPPSDARLPDDSLGAMRRELSESTNSDRLSRTQVRVQNQDNYGDKVADDALDNALVRILLGFGGLSYADYALLMTGRVDNYELSWDFLTLDVTDARYQLHRDLSTRLGDQAFPGTPSAQRGQAIPFLIGRISGHTPLQVAGEASGTLAFAMLVGQNFCRLNESEAAFPEQGTIDIDTETNVTYTSRRPLIIQGVTYLQLEGLTRPSPSEHDAGVAVTLMDVSYVYLVGYEAGAVSAVYEDEVEVSEANYSVQQGADGADFPVTLLTFSTEPTGALTVDVDGRDAEPQAELLNGGFETGDLTGWTASGGATASATSGDTPDDSTYKLELTGGEDTWEDAYQDFATRRDRYYSLRLSYQDTDSSTNLLSNGGFETDATTGWTEDENLGFVSRSLYTGFQDYPDFGRVPEGDQALSVNGFDVTFSYSFYQDVTTVIGLDYVFSFLHFGHKGSTSGSGSAWSQWQSQVGYKLSTDDDATIYADTLLDAYPYTSQFVPIAPVAFTAVSTTTRILIRCTSEGTQFTYPVYFDKVSLIQADTVQSSYSRVQVGTPTDPTAALELELEPSYNWSDVQLAFQAAGNVTRVSLGSQWTGATSTSYFDAVDVTDGGRNPALEIGALIDLYLPQWQRDVASFEAAAEQLAGWEFSAVIGDPGASKALLDALAAECKSSVLEGADGKLKLIVDAPADTPVHAFTTDDIDENTLRVRRESGDNIYTDFELTFGASGQFTARATPDDTTHPTLDLAALCANAADFYGTRREYRQTLRFIRDVTTAHHLLAYLVSRHTQRQFIATLRTSSQATVALERGDTVSLAHPLLYQAEPMLCQVRGHEISGAGVSLTLRTWIIPEPPVIDEGLTLGGIMGSLRLWLRADDLAETYSDGEFVGSWTDASLNAIEFTSIDSGNRRPVFKENILNGHAVVRLNGSTNSDGMSVSPNPLADLHGAEGLTVFIVTMLNPEVSGCTWIYAWDPPSNGFRISQFGGIPEPEKHNPYFQMKWNSDGYVYGSTDLDDGAYHLLVCRFDGTAPAAQIYLDGGPDEVLVSNNIPATLSMSGNLFLCDGSSDAPDGDLAEILVYERALSAAERQAVENYLLSKYDIG